MKLALDLSGTFGDFQLAAETSIDLQGVTALFGPSGAGKSTVLAAIAGFRPGTGSITVDGVSWQSERLMLPAHRRPVGIVFQEGRLFEHLTTRANLRYAQKRADRTGPRLDWGDVIETLDLAPLLDRPATALSGGERQRVAIGRALLTRPRLMLMDEPLAALDRARKAALLPLIAELPTRFGIPVIYVSHQLDEIVQIADTLIAMREGRITGHGPVADMIAGMDPAITGRFEAGSVLEGEVNALEPDFEMAAIGIGADKLWVPDVGSARLGERVRVRIRARDVSLSTAHLDAISIRNQLVGTVRGIETDGGPFAEVRMDCAGQALRARISRMALADLRLVPGQRVWALIKSVAFDRRLSQR